MLVISSLEQFVDQGGGGGEAHPSAFLAGRQPQRQRQMRLARTGIAQRPHVLSAVEILRTGQFQHQALVHRRDRAELTGLETLQDRELGGLDAPLGGALLAIEQLQLAES